MVEWAEEEGLSYVELAAEVRLDADEAQCSVDYSSDDRRADCREDARAAYEATTGHAPLG